LPQPCPFSLHGLAKALLSWKRMTEVKEVKEAKIEAEDEEEQDAEEDYCERVAKAAFKHNHRQELQGWLDVEGIDDASTHVAHILKVSGVKDYERRLAQVEQALREQTQLMKERKKQKSREVHQSIKEGP